MNVSLYMLKKEFKIWFENIWDSFTDEEQDEVIGKILRGEDIFVTVFKIMEKRVIKIIAKDTKYGKYFLN